MANFYTYPHVNFTTKTTARRVPEALDSTATKLLAPFTSDRGPENTLVPIDTYADFVATFGQLNYGKADQRQLLNIGAWLANGGRVMACRLTDIDISLTGYTNKAKKADGYVKLKSDSNSKYDDASTITAGSTYKYTAITETDYSSSTTYYTWNSSKEKYEQYTGSTYIDGLFIRAADNDIKYTVRASAKYSGTYYNDISIKFIRTTNGYFKINVLEGTSVIEAFASRNITDMDTIDALSDYVDSITLIKGDADVAEEDQEIVYSLDADELNKFSNDFTIKLSGGENTYTTEDGDFDFLESIEIANKGLTSGTTGYDANAKSNMVYILSEVLKQPLETPVDCFIDCGYSEKVKKEMLELCCIGKTIKTKAADGSNIEVNEKRDDIFLFLSTYTITGNGKRKDNGSISAIEESTIVNDSTGFVRKNDNFSNALILDYYGKVQDIYSETSCEVYVTATYAYANLIPYNDAVYGPHKSTAGLTRGVVTKIFANQWINSVPSNLNKQEHWNNHINYIEKDSRGTYIMSELTCNKNNNILDRVYAARTLIKMKKDLTLIGRRVLHEYNDSIVQARLRSECDAYLATWLQNGALSAASVDLIDYTRRPSLSDTELVVAINIKFKNTIDVIPFEITL